MAPLLAYPIRRPALASHKRSGTMIFLQAKPLKNQVPAFVMVSFIGYASNSAATFFYFCVRKRRA